ncbi:hypothetical protein ACODUO_14855 [Stenotrophomonas maltophilia]
MVDYTDGTLNALAGGFNFGRMVKDARDEQQFNRLAQLSYEAPQEQRQSLLGQMAAISPRAAQQQEQSFASADERRNTTMVNMAKLLTSAPEQARPALWQRFVPTLSQFGLSQLPTEYNAETAPVIDQAAQSLVQAYGGGVGGNVQSTYIDGNGNRVAIMRDGSQRVLGPNNASIRVMEQEGALPYGVVTSGGRPGAVVDIGGAQVPAQGATGQYTIDPSLPPEVQQQIRAAEAAGQQVPSNMVLPPRSGPVRVPTAAEKAAASEAGRLSVQQQYLPQELAMRTQAALAQEMGKAQVSAQAEQAATSRSNNTAARVYEEGMGGAIRALAGSSTGPIVGRLPALTSEQQIAEGGISAMAPVLKQMFRVAGEGTFTDKDQDLLMAMLPTRKDSPEAREAKAANVDNIVRAKLNMGPPQKATNPKTGETLYLRFGQWVKK